MILSEMYKKILTIIVLFLLLGKSVFFPPFAYSQGQSGDKPWYAPDYQDFIEKTTSAPEGEIFGERYTHAQVYWIIYSLISFAIERKISECYVQSPANDLVPGLNSFINCLTGNDPSNSSVPNSSGLGFLEFAKMSDSMLVSRPASTVVYVASILNKFGVPTAYAQQSGFGFNTLLPVFGLWTASRNGSYALVTLAVILLAFMVMFRTRISPQVTIGVTSAIPRIIIGLLLITFSFAIAGLVIDFSFVLLGIIAGVFHSSGIIDTQRATIIDTFNMANDLWGGIFNFGVSVVYMIIRSFGSATGVAVSLLSVGIIPVIASILVLIIALILIIIAVVRIFWIFLKSYVSIILHVVALPFAALMYMAWPGSNTFVQLLRSLVGNVSVFLTIPVSIMIAHVLLWGMSGAGSDLITIGNVYRVRGIGGDGFVRLPGFTGVVDMTTIGLFVGITVALMAPSLANNIKSLIISGRTTREGLNLVGAGLAGAAGGAVVGSTKLAAGAVLANPAIAGTAAARIIGRLPYIVRSSAASSLGYKGIIDKPTGSPRPGSGRNPTST